MYGHIIVKLKGLDQVKPDFRLGWFVSSTDGDERHDQRLPPVFGLTLVSLGDIRKLE